MNRVRQTKTGQLLLAFLLMLMTIGLATESFAQKKKDKKSKGDASEVGKKPGPGEKGTPMLWMDRGDISKLNLHLGIGASEENMPKAPFTFDKEDTSGTNPKIKIIDANGVKWNMKFDEEVHAEVACSRIAWACGYMVEESYFLTSGKVNGVSGLGRAKKFVGSDGSFSNAMFEKRPDTIERRAMPWPWDSNPFSGTKELSGLVILNVMLNNWDAKVDNNNVLGMYAPDGKTVHDWYLVADWGGTLGKMGGFTSHSKWDPDAFEKQAFIDRVSGNSIKFHYTGKMSSAVETVPMEHARWFAGIVGQLTDAQLRDAFKAAGASSSETERFARRIRAKIEELKSKTGVR
jgi:hypothetical protein